MSVRIEPVDVEKLNSDEVRQYDLPVGEGFPTILYLDVSKEGYSAEWYSTLSVSRFENTVLENAPKDRGEAVATFQPKYGCRPNHPEKGSMEDFLHPNRFYPDECTYLQLRSPKFDIAWERWEPANNIILTARDKDPEILKEFLFETSNEPPYSESGEVSEEIGQISIEKAYDQAVSILEAKSE